MWDTNKLSNTPIKTLPHPSFIYKDLILSYKSYDDDTDNWYIQNIYFSRVWDTKKLSNTPIKTLPHPSFIYTAKFHPRVPKILVTGGYDRIVRIWTAEGQDAHATVSLRLKYKVLYSFLFNRFIASKFAWDTCDGRLWPNRTHLDGRRPGRTGSGKWPKAKIVLYLFICLFYHRFVPSVCA